jgi:hypothetical protein
MLSVHNGVMAGWSTGDRYKLCAGGHHFEQFLMWYKLTL